MAAGPLKNACDTLLSQNPGSLPNVQGAMANWFQPLKFAKIIKEVVNFQVVETQVITNFMGVRQPMKPKDLEIMPEGQRAWSWEMIHAYPDLVLAVDDIIYFNGVPYRVMNKHDWTEYGYLRYDIKQDYTNT